MIANARRLIANLLLLNLSVELALDSLSVALREGTPDCASLHPGYVCYFFSIEMPRSPMLMSMPVVFLRSW